MKKRLAMAAGCLILTVNASASDSRQLILRLAPTASVDTVAKAYNCRVLDRTPGAPFALLRAMSASHAERVALAMRSDPRVIWTEDNDPIRSPEGQHAFGTVAKKGGSVPAVGDRTKLVNVNSEYLTQINWTSSLVSGTGRTVRVAILDTGLSRLQTALWSKVVASVNLIEPGSPAYDQPKLEDSNGNGLFDEAVGHGTMVAGLIDVVSPSSRLVIARVADSDGNASAWSIIRGLAFAVTSGAEVANVSLGTLGNIPALSDTIDWCERQRLTIVASIGNDALRATASPSRFSNVICVAGLNADSTKASFSNWSNRADVAAPAVGLASQFWDGELAAWSGTSFAAPMVSASIVEYLRQTSGKQEPKTVQLALRAAVDNIDSINPTYRGELGGRLNVTRLVQTRSRP